MASATETAYNSDIVKVPFYGNDSFETVTIATSQTVLKGSALMRDGSGYFAVLAAAADGDKAEAIALEAVTTVGSTDTCLACCRAARVDESKVDFGSGTEADAKQALADRHILCRDTMDLQTL